jgi:hypothetical protein
VDMPAEQLQRLGLRAHPATRYFLKTSPHALILIAQVCVCACVCVCVCVCVCLCACAWQSLPVFFHKVLPSSSPDAHACQSPLDLKVFAWPLQLLRKCVCAHMFEFVDVTRGESSHRLLCDRLPLTCRV